MKVSAIVPVYNPGDYLIQCLESLVNQTIDPQELEIILVNDGSTDGSGQILENYASRYPNITLINKENGGYGQSMNRGLDIATGEYIAIVEPDDYVDVHMFEDLYNAGLGFSPHPDMIKSAYWRVLRDGHDKVYITPSAHKTQMRVKEQPFTYENSSSILLTHPSIWSAIYKREFLEREGIRFKEIPGAGWADNPFLIQTVCLAKSIIYVNECYYYYREDMIDGSARLKDYTVPFDRWNEMQDFIDEHGIDCQLIKTAQACRGFSYIVGARNALNAGANSKDLQARTEAMYRRMDFDTVVESPAIPKWMKRDFVAVVNPGYSGKLKGGYYSGLPKLLFHSLKDDGLAISWYRVRAYFARK